MIILLLPTQVLFNENQEEKKERWFSWTIYVVQFLVKNVWYQEKLIMFQKMWIQWWIWRKRGWLEQLISGG